MGRYDSISPLDYRYCSGEVLEKLQPYLSETASVRYQLMAEAALAKALAEEKICSGKVAAEIEKAAKGITAEEVYEEEKKIRHNVRALVNCIRKRVSAEAKPYVHLTATSNDIISTAEAARMKDCAEKVLIPELLQLERTLIALAEREKNTLQIGRTHGQHAEPITFGFAIANYVSRLGGRIEKIKQASAELRGKFSGAVGNYNAASLLVKEPEKFEEKVLKKLGLKPATTSTQIAEAEYMTDLMHSAVSAFGVMANIADDMRHLQRTEIGEVAEKFEAGQVGSSTMPHKRNPINFENVKSLWKEFMPRMATVYMDQISEHQRDLTNSASSRFNTEIMAAAVTAADRLNKAMQKLAVDREGLKRNFEITKGKIAAEPAYIMLAALGHEDAHEAVRKITLEADKSGMNFAQLLLSSAELSKYTRKFTKEQIEIIKNPEKYGGIAAEKTGKVVKEWRARLKIK